MPGIAVGIDFGTSNSAAAVPGDGSGAPARVLRIDAEAEMPALLPSVLFFPEDTFEVAIGTRAIRRYLSEGEGRFIQSMKSFLPSTLFQATVVRCKPWKLVELIARVLQRIREAVEQTEGAPVSRVVLGRPAVFSPDPGLDRLAEDRLRAAAQLAGLENVAFVIEPIAAALHYEQTLEHDETVLVGDFGAGTSDFTLMHLGPGRRGRLDRRADVVASSGVRVGGDRFDAAIVEHLLLPHFGHLSTWQGMTARLQVPLWMTRKLLAWHELSMLRERSTMEFLARALKSSDAPTGLRNLMTLAESNLGYHLYRAVEAAKRRLSDAPSATVSFHQVDIDLELEVSRRDFERWTAPLREELTAATDRVLARAGGVEPQAVFLTGGSSAIPSVRRLFEERFGRERLREGDAFTSVVAGLGRAASLSVDERWESATLAR